MTTLYTDEKNVQILIALIKAHGIRYVIASPGSANSPFVASLQRDPYFKMYSSVDERSAAYMACGLAAESGECVIISCTGATASRNYLPGLTEAYYRKLPVLAITSSQQLSRVGHHVAQVIDRSSKPNDVAKLSVTLPVIKDDEDVWDCEIKVNKAILELSRHGGGPVHINLATNSMRTFTTKDLPRCRVIRRVTATGNFPELPAGRVAVFVGSHPTWGPVESEALDRFCVANNAVVFCDHTSSYKGKHRLLYAMVACQKAVDQVHSSPELLIHIGEVSGDYASIRIPAKQVWRVSEDGEIRDTFRKLSHVFEMPEHCFFDHYARTTPRTRDDEYSRFCKGRLDDIHSKIPEIPYSNIWCASKMAHRIPAGSVIHFAILNSLRSWNLFELPASVLSASNVGGFGIDGIVSSLLGASLANTDKLYFGVVGDLAFFYDMNALGNRHVGRNLRILLVNNGKGTEFKQYNHHTSHFGDEADDFIAAAGHFGRKSPTLVKHYAEDLGFEYLAASNKDEFDKVYERFLTPTITEKPILFEVFTESVEESKALEIIMNIEGGTKGRAKNYVKSIFGEKTVSVLKSITR